MSYSLYFYDFFIHKFYEKIHFHRLLLIDKYDLNLKIIIIKACALPSSSMRMLQYWMWRLKLQGSYDYPPHEVTL